MFPKRVGEPKMKASAHSRSASSASAMSAVASRWAAHFAFWAMASGEFISRTFRRRTSAPASVAPSATAWARAKTFPVALE